MQQWLAQIRSYFNTLPLSRYSKTLFTASISVIGISIAASYYFDIFASRNKKRIRNNKRKLIQTIPQLENLSVRIKNPNHVEKVLTNIIQSGKERLQVISDFDRTISLHVYEGKPCLTSNSVLEKSRFIHGDLRVKFQELRDLYLPIEHDPKMTKEEKIPFMIEWWTKTFELICESQITRDNLIEIVRNSTTHLKEGCKWLFNTLEHCDIPLLIFSAGLGDIIQEWICQQCGSYKNIKIVSNFMSFDCKTNRINGFQGNMIHIFNKNEGVLLDTDYEKMIENRQNVILLGDSVGDVDMAAGIPNLQNILKIGFLNEHPEELLARYMDIYDIVLVNDSTFEVPNGIIRSII